jgi:hypothetical protein
MFHNAGEQHDGLFYPANLGPYANVGPTWSFISDKQMMLPFYESSRQIELIKNRIRWWSRNIVTQESIWW